MNKTKKLTQGAMMLAIVGALILIDRITAYFFSEIVVLMIPVVIIMYSSMHTLKDGLFLSIGVLIIAFILGNFQFIYLIYAPVGVITGLIYSLGVKKNMDKRSIMFLGVFTYIIGELISMFVIYPIIGFPVSQLISEYKVSLEEMSGVTGFDLKSILATFGKNLDSLIVVIYIISTIITGAMEGIIIHLISLFMLKRFKIKDLGRTNIWDIKANPVLAYISFISLFGLYFRNRIENQVIFCIVMSIAILGMIVLLYYAYIFVCLYGAIILKRNIGFFFVLLILFIPSLLVTALIIGFLYAAGPLRRYLENKVNQINNFKNPNE